MSEEKWFENDKGLSVKELVAIESKYRTDSIVCAIEEIVSFKDDNDVDINAEELLVLAIEAMEREVNNGGFSQFFSNNSWRFTPYLVDCLSKIGSTQAKEMAEKAITALDIGNLTDATEYYKNMQNAIENEAVLEKLEAIDKQYYAMDENIAGLIFEFIKNNVDKYSEITKAMITNSLPAGPTSEAEIVRFEEHIGHNLSEEYRMFLLEHNGGRPKPDAFTLVMDDTEEENLVYCLFPMQDISLGNVKVEDLRSWPIHCAWQDLQDDLANLYKKELDEPLLPIGTDGSSNYFCIVLAGKQKGSILFLEHEMAETAFIADSFSGFLGALRPRERTDYAPGFD